MNPANLNLNLNLKRNRDLNQTKPNQKSTIEGCCCFPRYYSGFCCFVEPLHFVFGNATNFGNNLISCTSCFSKLTHEKVKDREQQMEEGVSKRNKKKRKRKRRRVKVSVGAREMVEAQAIAK